MFKFLIIAAFVPAMVFGQATPKYTQCLDGSPLPYKVETDMCGEAEICELVRGKDVNVWLSFTALDDMVDPQAYVRAEAVGVITTYPLPDDVADVCQNLDRGECPLAAEVDATYNMLMHVSIEFPITPLVLEISVRDAGNDNKAHSCFRIQAQTVDQV